MQSREKPSHLPLSKRADGGKESNALQEDTSSGSFHSSYLFNHCLTSGTAQSHAQSETAATSSGINVSVSFWMPRGAPAKHLQCTQCCISTTLVQCFSQQHASVFTAWIMSVFVHPDSLLTLWKSLQHLPPEAVAGQDDADGQNNRDHDGNRGQRLIGRPILSWKERDTFSFSAF